MGEEKCRTVRKEFFDIVSDYEVVEQEKNAIENVLETSIFPLQSKLIDETQRLIIKSVPEKSPTQKRIIEEKITELSRKLEGIQNTMVVLEKEKIRLHQSLEEKEKEIVEMAKEFKRCYL